MFSNYAPSTLSSRPSLESINIYWASTMKPSLTAKIKMIDLTPNSEWFPFLSPVHLVLCTVPPRTASRLANHPWMHGLLNTARSGLTSANFFLSSHPLLHCCCSPSCLEPGFGDTMCCKDEGKLCHPRPCQCHICGLYASPSPKSKCWPPNTPPWISVLHKFSA